MPWLQGPAWPILLGLHGSHHAQPEHHPQADGPLPKGKAEDRPDGLQLGRYRIFFHPNWGISNCEELRVGQMLGLLDSKQSIAP